MNDKELFEDLLTTLKGSCDLYMHGSIESANTNVNNTFNETLFETLKMQNDVYNLMKNNGWYNIQNVDQNKLETTKAKVSQA